MKWLQEEIIHQRVFMHFGVHKVSWSSNLSVVLSNMVSKSVHDDEIVSISDVNNEYISHVSSSDSDYEMFDTDISESKSGIHE
jgi:hypothetical protein